MDDKLTTKDAITVLRNLQDWLYFSAMNGGTRLQREAIDMAIGALKQPEIVRCGECKYLMPNGRCRMFADDRIKPSASDFCSRAKRRDVTT